MWYVWTQQHHPQPNFSIECSGNNDDMHYSTLEKLSSDIRCMYNDSSSQPFRNVGEFAIWRGQHTDNPLYNETEKQLIEHFQKQDFESFTIQKNIQLETIWLKKDN
jgi:hypothetical protein